MLELIGDQGELIQLKGLEYRRHLGYLDILVVFPYDASYDKVDFIYQARHRTWQINWQDNPLFDSLQLSSCLSQANNQNPLTQQNFCFVPQEQFEGERRYQVHSFSSFLNLLQSFNNILTISDEDIRSELAQVKLTNFILQENITDRTFVRQLIGEWNQLKPKLPLALSWSKKGWKLVSCWPRQSPPTTMYQLTQQPWNILNIHTASSIEEITTNLSVWFSNEPQSFNLDNWIKEQNSDYSHLPHLLKNDRGCWLVGERRDNLISSGGGNTILEWSINIRATQDFLL